MARASGPRCSALAALAVCGLLLAAGPGGIRAEDSASASPEADPLKLSDQIGCDGTSVLSALTMTPELRALRASLRVAGLQGRLNDEPGNVTVFAPTDRAFAEFLNDVGTDLTRLFADPTTLRHLLLYHMLPRGVSPEQLRAAPVFQTFWADKEVFVPQPFQGVVSGESGTTARISKSVKVCNSYIYLISYVLLPGPSLEALPPFAEYKPPAQSIGLAAGSAAGTGGGGGACSPNATVLDLLQSNANLSVLISMVETAKLSGALANASAASGPGVTLLAPLDEAWREAAGRLQMPNASADGFRQLDSATLRTVLLGHVIPRYLPPAKLASQLYGTLAGPAAGPVLVSAVPGNVTLQTPTTDARVVGANAADVCNVAVYLIDSVLLPARLPAPPAEVQTKRKK
ncbi:hypothetical protein GPECTOR_1g501 [Gonium pectorale]|uniref:FAS1 domain-containing protein n=1 Tax=Gonium pectorale TaxID=33097 RepID=A0A150H313_GONPE|nr:hypothetical protein GPECTOR_1g501 [Gonium pectorale]|eukprot:KXZ56559.1 hypothetical protein GPECTOR_1g501 [Gonium pectorale]